jgi:hypothetical protein
MRQRLHAVLPLALVLAGCRDKGALPGALAGSFVPQDQLVPAIRTHLNVTPTGLTVTRYGTGGSGSLSVNGKPVVEGSADVGTGGAALFAKLQCDGDLGCTFTTKNGCEGSLTGDGKGNVVLIVTGECSSWSGKWMAEKDAPAASAVPSATCPPAPACPPCAEPPPSASASASAAPRDQLTCITDCNHAHVTCIHQCKMFQSECMTKCGLTTSACVHRCQ